jgi:hypothetical protein
MDFFRSIRGVQFAETIIRELPKLVKELKRANDLKEAEQAPKPLKLGNEKIEIEIDGKAK